jgi:hypothetical protein
MAEVKREQRIVARIKWMDFEFETIEGAEKFAELALASSVEEDINEISVHADITFTKEGDEK